MGESIVAELKNYATNYYTSGNGEIDLAGALEQLRGRKKILENEIRMEMAQKQQKREKLEQEISFVWRDVHHLEEELERVEEELAYRLEKEEEKKKERQREKEAWKRCHGCNSSGKMEDSSNGASGVCTGYCDRSHLVLETVELSDRYCVIPCVRLIYMEPDESWKKTGRKQSREIILEEIAQEEEKVPIEKLRWEKSHITAELKEKRIQYDNLGEQLAELDEVNERSREYEMKRQAVQMAADHLEQLSEEMRGYLKEI